MDPRTDKDITYFARTNFRGTDQIFGIKRKDRRQHTYVLGKSGTGKSVLLENMIIQNIQNGEGVCVVDPHGELAEKILESIPAERAKDVIYFNPADTDNPMGFNVLQLDDPKYKHLVASGLMGIFTKIWANVWSSRMEYILNNAILALLDTPDTTLLGIPRLLVDKDYRQYVIGNLKDPVVKAFWVHEFEAWKEQFRNEAIAPIQNKVGQFLSSSIVRNVVGQSRSAINIFDIMNEQKILIINVSKGRIGEDNSALLGGMMITKIQLAAMERVRIPEQERKDFYLYIDEFQNFSTESFGSILSEARKYRLCLIIAHQYTAQLDEKVRDAVFGNVGTMIVFRVGADDADNVEKEFSPEFTVEDFVNLPNYHIYTKLMVDGVTSRPFSARTLPPIEIETTPEVQELVVATSRKLYTKPRETVESEIDRWSSTVPGSQQGPDEGDVSAGKFKVTCVNDGKVIYVPFEPKPGLPVYCKECLFKIKNGELEPLPGYRAPRENKEKNSISYDSLASLGIEFQGQASRSDSQLRSNTVLNPLRSIGQKIQNAIQGGPTPVKKQETVRRDTMQQQSMSSRPTQAPKIPNLSERSVSNNSATISNTSTPRPTPVVNQQLSRMSSSTPAQKPRVSAQKEKQGPDTLGLRSLLSEVVGTVISNSKETRATSIVEAKKEEKGFKDPYKDVPKVVTENTETISLKDLSKTQESKIEKNNRSSQAIPPKDASEVSKSALLEALLKNKKEESESQPSVENISEVVAAPVIEKQEENPVATSIVIEKNPEAPSFVISETMPSYTAPEIKKETIILEEVAKKDSIPEKIVEDTVVSVSTPGKEATDASDDQPVQSKKIREVPEDILKSILE